MNPFPSEEEEEDEPHGVPHYRKSMVQTETVSQVTTEAYIQTPAKDVPPLHPEQKLLRKYPRRSPVHIDHDQEQAP